MAVAVDAAFGSGGCLSGTSLFAFAGGFGAAAFASSGLPIPGDAPADAGADLDFARFENAAPSLGLGLAAGLKEIPGGGEGEENEEYDGAFHHGLLFRGASEWGAD